MSKEMKSQNELRPAVAPAVEREQIEGEPTGASTTDRLGALPNPEVRDRPVRRTYTAEYKRRIVAEADAASEPGVIGALLRREGLYSSLLSQWRQGRARAEQHAFEPSTRGPKAVAKDARDADLARLTREVAALEKKLRKAELIIDFQKKVSQILGIALPALEDDANGRRP